MQGWFATPQAVEARDRSDGVFNPARRGRSSAGQPCDWTAYQGDKTNGFSSSPGGWTDCSALARVLLKDLHDTSGCPVDYDHDSSVDNQDFIPAVREAVVIDLDG